MIETNLTQVYQHALENNVTTFPEASDFDIMRILQISISSVGMVANVTVVIAFINHKQLRGKIPNMYIINQVSHLHVHFSRFPQI